MPETYYRKQRVKGLWGLIEYKPQWTLTLQGWLVVLFALVALMLLIVAHIHPFLAYSAPIKADGLVVEGWIEDDALQEAMAEFKRGDYKLLITTGLPLSKGYFLAEYKNSAELAAATLLALGFERDKLAVVPAPNVLRNRTAASAIALRQWLSNSGVLIQSINLYSFDVHTRRSWLLFKQTLAPEIEVGAIAYPSSNYDPKQWWTSSAGVRSVISETIAYLYTKAIGWRN